MPRVRSQKPQQITITKKKKIF